jgi:hypothetical protein
LRDGKLAAQLHDARLRRIAGGPAVVQLRARDAADPVLSFVASELRGALLLVHLRLRKLGARDVLLGRPATLLQVRELRFGNLDLFGSLALRGRLAHRFERVQPRADGHLVAALDGERIDAAGERRRDIDEFAFDVTLVSGWRLARACGKRNDGPQRCCGRRAGARKEARMARGHEGV